MTPKQKIEVRKVEVRSLLAEVGGMSDDDYIEKVQAE